MDTRVIHTDCLFDPKAKAFVKDRSIAVNTETGLITEVFERSSALTQPVQEPDIDLRGKCVLPGLVDAHTHIFLHSAAATPSIHQERDESFVARVIRATNHCRAALLAGYTTYRDLGTEGARDADTHVRNAVNRGLVPGPRIFCATQPLASSGGYEVRQENALGGTAVPRLADACDGVVGVRAGVRRRLGAGADVIKVYADYRKRALRFPAPAWPGCADVMFAPEGQAGFGLRNPSLLLFNQEEMDEIVREARASCAPVAAHAQTAAAVAMAARAGVTSVEHAFEAWEGSDALQALMENKTIFVPTLAVLELYFDMEPILAQVKKAYGHGVKLACGGDTGAVPHGDNVRELELMLKAGIPLEEVLTAATLHGWEACGGDWCGRRFGWFDKGCAADIIALDGDLRNDTKALRHVDFVMKDARVWKQDGLAVGMT